MTSDDPFRKGRTSSASAQVRDAAGRILPLVAAAGLTAFAYSNAFQGDFQFDDFAAITDNPRLASWGSYWDAVGRMVRPLLYFTYRLDASMFGAAPGGYHALNVLLHFGCGALVFRVVRLACTGDPGTVPFWTALLFVVHPLATEAVTYISGRASVLMAFGYLAALLLFVQASAPDASLTRRRLGLIGSLACFAAALASKETAMTLPAALLLWDVFVRDMDRASLRRAFFQFHLPYWLMLLATGLAAMANARYRDLAQFSFDIRPLWSNVLSELHAAVYSIALYFEPWYQNFDHDLSEVGLPSWSVVFDLGIVAGLVAAGACGAWRHRVLAFGAAWFGLQWLPLILIPRNDLLSERNLYLASAGLILGVVSAGSDRVGALAARVRRPKWVLTGARALAFAVVIALSWCTFKRNELYRDGLALWTDTVRKSAAKARPHNNLGHELALRGEWDRAIDEFRIAVQLRPDYTRAQRNLRAAYLHQVGRP
jgi:protein O-mannosyl-transferase